MNESNGLYDDTKREKRWRGEIGQWGERVWRVSNGMKVAILGI